jgi:sugar phosphate isomerase/epimerase
MKLGISTLAWDVNNDNSQIFSVLRESNINFIEIVLPKFITWGDSNLTNILKFKNLALEYNIDIISTQSIMYNSNVDSFTDTEFITHISYVSDICSKLNINNIVLGAPTLRKFINNFDLYKVFNIIDIIISNNNQLLLLEPNSKFYKGDYFYDISEIVKFIQHGEFNNICTMIDTHNSILENNIPCKEFKLFSDMIRHVHVSENNLTDYIDSAIHVQFANELKHANYDGLIIYESKPSINLERSIKLFSNTYNI